MNFFKNNFAALVLVVTLVGCGGGEVDNTVALSVPVSSGYPILGSTVTLKGANGVSVSAKGSDTTGIATFTVSQVANLNRFDAFGARDNVRHNYDAAAGR